MRNLGDIVYQMLEKMSCIFSGIGDPLSVLSNRQSAISSKENLLFALNCGIINIWVLPKFRERKKETSRCHASVPSVTNVR